MNLLRERNSTSSGSDLYAVAKKAKRQEDNLGVYLRGQQVSRSISRHLTRHYFYGGTWKPCNAPNNLGQQFVKIAYGVAGLGGRKKRTLRCNGVDISCNIT